MICGIHERMEEIQMRMESIRIQRGESWRSTHSTQMKKLISLNSDIDNLFITVKHFGWLGRSEHIKLAN